MNIRETILIMTSVAMTALSACEPIASDRFGFDLPVGPRSGGINNVEVDFTVSAIRLTGNIIASKLPERCILTNPCRLRRENGGCATSV